MDISNLIDQLKDTWIRWAVTLIMNAVSVTPGLTWLRWPIISAIFETIIRYIMTAIANGLEMEGMFYQTAIRKADQAHEYIHAHEHLKSVVTEKDYELAEKIEMALFHDFVVLN